MDYASTNHLINRDLEYATALSNREIDREEEDGK